MCMIINTATTRTTVRVRMLPNRIMYTRVVNNLTRKTLNYKIGTFESDQGDGGVIRYLQPASVRTVHVKIDIRCDISEYEIIL